MGVWPWGWVSIWRNQNETLSSGSMWGGGISAQRWKSWRAYAVGPRSDSEAVWGGSFWVGAGRQESGALNVQDGQSDKSQLSCGDPTCGSVWTLSLVAQCLWTWTTSFEDKSRSQPWGLGLGSRCLPLGDHAGHAPPTLAFQLGTSDRGTPEWSVCGLRQSSQPGCSPWGLTPEPPGGSFGLEIPFWGFNCVAKEGR